MQPAASMSENQSRSIQHSRSLFKKNYYNGIAMKGYLFNGLLGIDGVGGIIILTIGLNLLKLKTIRPSTCCRRCS
jgi:uncharacterized membrane protein YqgA involved in biofilm formation